MARILGGGAFGEMRGKLGSMVFARNKGGAYARSYAKPVDPATIAQLSARSNFGISAGIYHGLSDSNKALWNEFATNTFNPKTGKFGNSSGFNAFVALANAVNNVKLFDTYELVGTATIATTAREFVVTDIPPSFALQPNIKITTGGPGWFGINIANISNIAATPTSDILKLSGTIEIGSTGIVGGGTTSATISDSNGIGFGFKVYMSNPVPQAAMFIQNPYMIDLGTIPALAMTTPANISTGFTLNWSRDLPSANYQNLPSENTFVQLTIFQISRQGALNRLGAKIVKLT